MNTHSCRLAWPEGADLRSLAQLQLGSDGADMKKKTTRCPCGCGKKLGVLNRRVAPSAVLVAAMTLRLSEMLQQMYGGVTGDNPSEFQLKLEACILFGMQLYPAMLDSIHNAATPPPKAEVVNDWLANAGGFLVASEVARDLQ
jgi:hypothetical protein